MNYGAVANRIIRGIEKRAGEKKLEEAAKVLEASADNWAILAKQHEPRICNAWEEGANTLRAAANEIRKLKDA
jgi:hypothetical protein